MRHRACRAAEVAAVAGAALLLTACGSGTSSTSGGAGAGSSSAPPATSAVSSSATDAALAAEVPQAVKADGKITVGTDSTYAPNEFIDKDGKTVIGFDVDLFNAVAAKLGLQTQYVSAPFDNIIPSVQSGKYEIGVSSFTINPERKKVVNMVSYFSAGTQWAAKKGNRAGVQPDAACGKKIAVQRGTVQVADVTARSRKCTSAGQSQITIEQYQGQDQATAAVVSGKDDAMLADSPVAAYAIQQTRGQLETLGSIYDSAPYGYAIKKDQTQFARAVTSAVKATVADGSYKAALEKWGVQAGAIPTPKLNP